MSPAFPGFWPGRWSNKGVAGNIIGVIPALTVHGARVERENGIVAFYAKS